MRKDITQNYKVKKIDNSNIPNLKKKHISYI